MANALIIAPTAPSTNLDRLPSESQELVNTLGAGGFAVQLLQSPVTLLELYRTLQTGRKFALVWFIGHSSEEGFMLDTEILTAPTLAMFLNDSQTQNLVLNGCSTYEHVIHIQYAAPHVNIVATMSDIEDSVAWSSALYFARSFVQTKDLQKAIPDTQYRFFPAKRMYPMNDNEIQQITRTVDSLVRTLRGDEFSSTPGLIGAIQNLQQDLTKYVAADAEWKRQTESRIIEIEKTIMSRQISLSIPYAMMIIGCVVIFTVIILYVARMY